LQRLRGEIAGRGDGRHEQPIARPKKQQQKDDGEDDPTYVLEDTNQSLTKAEYEALVAGENAEHAQEKSTNDEKVPGEEQSDPENSKSATAAETSMSKPGQLTRKRKAVKVVGDDADDQSGELGDSKQKAESKKPKKKKKAIKLSFDD